MYMSVHVSLFCIFQHIFENASLALGGTLDLVDRVLKQEVRGMIEKFSAP